MEEQQSLLSRRETEEDQDNSSEEWTESTTGSYYSDSDSSIPEWESSLDETTGQLIYIDCHPVVTQNPTETHNKNSSFTKTQNRKSTRNKFLRLIRRRESKRRSKRFHKNPDNLEVNKVTFQDFQEGEVKQVVLKVENGKTNKKGPLIESMLGLTVSPFSDGTRVMISGFTLNSETKKGKSIKIGDWLKKINDIDVTVQDLDQILEQQSVNSEVFLELQRVAGVEVTKDPPTNELTSRSKFVKQLTHFNAEENEMLNNVLCQQPIGILFINTDQITENGPEYEGISYCYPRPHEKNKLCMARGVFITLNHLLNEITKTKPVISTVYCNKQCHITYYTISNKLLLLMLPNNRVSKQEMLLLTQELICVLEFICQTVENCFEMQDKHKLDHFFSRFFTRILTSGLWPKAEQYVDIRDLSTKAEMLCPSQFEEVLLASMQLYLPDEAQVQIDDALFELEASDYREWNEDPLDCQRLFTILGSALYHSGYLLASHFVHGDLIDVHSFCRQYGLFHLSRTEPVRTLVIWREVFPYSCNRGLENTNSLFKMPEGKRYLLIVGSGKDLLTCIMEVGGCTEPPEINLGPDAFYVEEVQATLAHLQELGISELADRWLQTNPGNQVTIPELNNQKRKSEFLGNITFSRSSTNLNKAGSSPVAKKTEVTSILKRRSSDQGPLSHLGSISFHDDYDLQSEDSTSQGGYSERSEASDEPVLGRRHMREKKNLNDSDEEDSDIDDYGDLSQVSGSSYDLNELRQALLNDTNDLQPTRLTAGNENVLLHYVQLDSAQGIILCPPESSANSKLYETILDNFKKCSQSIRELFQNTIRFKNMPAEEMAKSVINKSLIAIKEYGVLFECSTPQEVTKKQLKFTYWVMGRLFYEPHPRELYVCYQDSIPQNLVEIAFKLGISKSGLYFPIPPLSYEMKILGNILHQPKKKKLLE